MSVKVTDVSPEAANNIHQQVREIGGDNYITKEFDDRCSGNDPLVLGATYEGEDAGYIVGYDRHQDGSYYLWMFDVIEEYRGKDVGQSLADAFEERVNDRGYDAVTVKTQPSDEYARMRKFLDERGYEVVNREPGRTDDEIWYEKSF